MQPNKSMISNILEKRYKITTFISVIYIVLLFFPALTKVNVDNPSNSNYYSYFDLLLGGNSIFKIILLALITIVIFNLSIKERQIHSSNTIDKKIILCVIMHFCLNRFIWKSWEQSLYPIADIFFTYIFYWLTDGLLFIIYAFGYVRDIKAKP